MQIKEYYFPHQTGQLLKKKQAHKKHIKRCQEQGEIGTVIQVVEV